MGSPGLHVDFPEKVEIAVSTCVYVHVKSTLHIFIVIYFPYGFRQHIPKIDFGIFGNLDL